MQRPYYGCETWFVKLPGNPPETVRLRVPEGNRKEDESMARYLVRKRLGIDALPRGTKTWPLTDVN